MAHGALPIIQSAPGIPPSRKKKTDWLPGSSRSMKKRHRFWVAQEKQGRMVSPLGFETSVPPSIVRGARSDPERPRPMWLGFETSERKESSPALAKRALNSSLQILTLRKELLSAQKLIGINWIMNGILLRDIHQEPSQGQSRAEMAPQ